ncbi:complement factor H-like isoform X2 [Corythoichthys intestinalis]|uniref:complement factor H-like isoform X2 n=1 Tax=Corythoichthys intestinalis TaxID=161448 RepID=UPI0025A59D8E|nr:complement factor H-like isoform X2 [Corythoichthys intestinalis]
MNTITQSCVLLLWMHTLTFVKCQDCTLEDFQNGPLYDSNFDTTNMENKYQSGQQVRVGCTVGHSGFFRLICADGTWQSRGTKCQPKPCGHPGEAQFANFHLEQGNDFVFGSQVKYTCHQGYQMVSRIDYRRCMAEGWSGTIPVCEAIQCPFIFVDDNVDVVGDLEEANFGNVVRFSCKNSFEILTGSTEMLCDENGEWTGRPPKCEAVKCTVPLIENGFVPGKVKEYKEHEILSYQCNPNYKRAEHRPSSCEKLGIRAEWSPTPACELIKCKVSLPAIRGTSYEPAYTSSFSPGDTLTVTCGESYYISTVQQTSAVSTCKDDGKWTIRPICLEVTCSNQRDPSVYRWDIYWGQRVKLGTSANFYCRQGYRRTNGLSQVTCTRDGWIPNPPCQEITCDSKDIHSATIANNGKQIYKNYETAYFTCKDSREQFALTCTDNGWHGTVYCPACLQPDVLHGFAVGPVHDTLYYTCNEGYKLPSNGWWGEAKCFDGLWSGLEQCIETNKCGETPLIANAKIKHHKNPNGHDESLQIICNDGYQSQINYILCVGGNWDLNGLSSNTICTLNSVTCSPPSKIENALITTSYQREYMYGSKVTFKCRENYMVEGKDTITCQNGKWDMVDIKCIPYCSKPKNVERLMTFTDNKEKYINNEVIEYRCIQPSEKTDGSATCVNGTWSQPIQCGACLTLPDVPHGHVSLTTKTEYEEGDVIQVTCETGYISGLPIRYKCSGDGWATVNPGHCFLKPCPLPENTPNGYYQIIQGDDLVFGATIKYFCNVGYQMISQTDTRTCLLDKWTNHVPICEPMTCETPPAVGGITITGLPQNEEGILPDRFLKFSCDVPGKQLHGSSLLICGQDGLWDKPFPSCEDIACKVGEIHPRLDVDELPPGNQTIRIGHKLRFRCSNGYALDGSEESECLPTGEWENPFPTCTEPCQVRDIPAGVHLSTKLHNTQVQQGQKLKFSCRLRGHMIRGKAEVECLPNGQWSDPFPTCGAPLECERPPYLAGGDTKYSTKYTYRHDEKVEYICQNYYVMEGQPYKTCKNGQWIGEMKCLKPCTVNRELMSTHNILFRYTRDDKLYSAHDDEIEFRCAQRTRHDGALSMRQKCIDGVMELPTCQ